MGYPQIFIRFYGCNIHCAYCDEPDFVKDRQNYTAEKVVAEIQPWVDLKPHSISITGGEPLIQVDALKSLFPHLTLPIYLETNGILPQNLKEVKRWLTYASVDFKSGYHEPFEEFMGILSDLPGAFVKYVMVRDFPDSDIHHITRIMSAINPAMPLIIQPVTPFAEVAHKATPEDIMRGFSLASKHLSDVRIIPQTHKFIGIK